MYLSALFKSILYKSVQQQQEAPHLSVYETLKSLCVTRCEQICVMVQFTAQSSAFMTLRVNYTLIQSVNHKLVT